MGRQLFSACDVARNTSGSSHCFIREHINNFHCCTCVCVCVCTGGKKKKKDDTESFTSRVYWVYVCVYVCVKRLDGSAEQALCILFMCGSTCARQRFSVSRPPINLKHVHLRTFSNLEPPPFRISLWLFFPASAFRPAFTCSNTLNAQLV